MSSKNKLKFPPLYKHSINHLTITKQIDENPWSKKIGDMGPNQFRETSLSYWFFLWSSLVWIWIEDERRMPWRSVTENDLIGEEPNGVVERETAVAEVASPEYLPWWWGGGRRWPRTLSSSLLKLLLLELALFRIGLSMLRLELAGLFEIRPSMFPSLLDLSDRTLKARRFLRLRV